MANEIRQRQLGIGGLVEDNPLTASATLLTSAGLASITGGVDSSHHMPVILDPDGAAGPPEVAYITSLTAGLGATGATGFARGQENTSARQHLAGTPWIHAPTLIDISLLGAELLSVVAASGAAQTLDVRTATCFDVTLTANCTFTFAGVAASGSTLANAFTLVLRQDATGSRTVTWPGSVKWPGGAAPVISSGASKVDVYSFMTVDGGTTWLGAVSGQDIR